MNTTNTTLMTADELFALSDDGHRHELVHGELRTMTPTGGEHGLLTYRLARIVGNFVEPNELGVVFGAETGFRIQSNPDTVRAPDLAFVRSERVPAGGIPKTFWPGAPDLAVEVISPGDRYEEVEEKVLEWLNAGVEIVWIINPRTRTVTVHSQAEGVKILSEADELTGGSVLPGFTCRISELFA